MGRPNYRVRFPWLINDACNSYLSCKPSKYGFLKKALDADSFSPFFSLLKFPSLYSTHQVPPNLGSEGRVEEFYVADYFSTCRLNSSFLGVELVENRQLKKLLNRANRVPGFFPVPFEAF